MAYELASDAYYGLGIVTLVNVSSEWVLSSSFSIPLSCDPQVATMLYPVNVCHPVWLCHGCLLYFQKQGNRSSNGRGRGQQRRRAREWEERVRLCLIFGCRICFILLSLQLLGHSLPRNWVPRTVDDGPSSTLQMNMMMKTFRRMMMMIRKMR